MPRARTALRLADVGEAAVLAQIARRFGSTSPGVAVAVGDDAALLERLGPTAVVATDMLVEGVDFRFAWASFADIGRKAAAVNLSDLAAMGATARGLLASVAIAPHHRVADLMALLSALHRTGKAYGAPLIGGDLSGSNGPLVISVTALGALRGRGLRRHLGRPGDLVAVTGPLGASAAGLALLEQRGKRRHRLPAVLRRAQLAPRPQVTLGAALLAAGCVRACADVSDGLARDALHLVGRGFGVELDSATLPIGRATRRAAAQLGLRPEDWALHGGEDFVLALAIDPRKLATTATIAERMGARLEVVGRVVKQSGCRIDGAPAVGGFGHFAPSKRSV